MTGLMGHEYHCLRQHILPHVAMGLTDTWLRLIDNQSSQRKVLSPQVLPMAYFMTICASSRKSLAWCWLRNRVAPVHLWTQQVIAFVAHASVQKHSRFCVQIIASP